MNRLKKIFFRWEFVLVIMLVAEIIIFGAINPRFLRLPVLLGSINDFASICIISVFVTFVLVSGGIDIQAGSIVGLTSIVMGLLWHDVGINLWVVIPMVLLVGAACGALSGFFIAYWELKLPYMQRMIIILYG